MKQLPTLALCALNRRSFAAIVFGALVLAACQSAGFGTNPSALTTVGKNALRSASQTAPVYTWQPYPAQNYDYQNNIVTGISNNKNSLRVVGVSYSKAAGPYKSFTGLQPTPTTPIPSPTANPPLADPPNNNPPDVYVSGVNDTHENNNAYSVGYLTLKNSNTCGTAVVATCGFIYDPSSTQARSELNAPNRGTGLCAQTYFSGTMDANIQVGYYAENAPKGSGCVYQAFEEYAYSTGTNPSGPQWIDFQFPPNITSYYGTITNSWAYGINEYGDVVGAFTATNFPGLQIGWELEAFHYSTLRYPISSSSYAEVTQPQEISFDHTVVGWYRHGGKTWGFLHKGQNWYQETYNNDGTTQTAVYGFDDSNFMVGEYDTGGGVWNGFIATCVKGSCSSAADDSRIRTSVSAAKSIHH